MSETLYRLKVLPNLVSARIVYRVSRLAQVIDVQLRDILNLSIHVERLPDVVQFLHFVFMPHLTSLSLDFTNSGSGFTRDQFTGILYQRDPPNLSRLTSLSITCSDIPPWPVYGLSHLLNITPQLQALRLSHMSRWAIVVDALASMPYPCPKLSLLELSGNGAWAYSLSLHMARLLDHRGVDGVCPIGLIRVVR